MATRKLEVQIVGDARSLDRALGRSEKHMKRFGQTSAKTSGMVSSRMKGAAKSAAGMAAGYASIAGAKRAVSTTEDLAKATLGLHKVLGLTVEQSSQWAAVAKVRGVETKALNQAFGTLSKNSVRAAEGGKAQADAFKKVGLSQKELKGIGFNELLAETADGLKGMKSGPEKADVAMRLLGRGWQTVGPVIREGSKGMREQLALATKYGATFSGGTVKSMQDFIAAQREAKFASLGLQVAFGTQVAPALTKVINKVSQFVQQMRTGKGTGGEFAKTAQDIANKVKAIVGPIASFVAKHPGIQKVGVAILGVGLALKALRFGAALTGIDKVAGGLRALAGTKAGQRMKESIVNGLSGLAGRIKGRIDGTRKTASSSMASVGSSAGRAGGSHMASGFTGTATGGISRSAKGGRLRGLAAKGGPMAGLGGAIGAAMALPIITEVGSKLGGYFRQLQGQFKGRGKGGDAIAKGLGIFKNFVPFGPIVRRKGGVVPAMAAGGTVPVRLSSGEMGIEPSGRKFMVPGRPVAADNVGAMVRPGTKILTGSGQAMMAMGASVNQALTHQAPHFAGGGTVYPGKGGFPRAASAAKAAGFKGNALITALAVAGAETGNFSDLIGDESMGGSYGPWQIHKPAHPQYNSRRLLTDWTYAAKAAHKISGGGRNWLPWTMFKNGGYRKFLGRARAAAAGAKGGAGAGGKRSGGSRSVSITNPAARTNPLLGNILQPLTDDALLGGIEAGKEGTGRRPLLTSVLEGIVPESTDYATRERVDLPSTGGRRRGGAGGRPAAGGKGRGGFKPGGGWGGSQNLVMHAIRGINQRKTYKRPYNTGSGLSDHFTGSKNAFAADISPGGDSVFQTIRRRLGVPARKYSWNRFMNNPVKGYKSQLLWYAPDGSHKDHVHLGINRMRRGGVVGGAQSFRRGTGRRGVRRPRRPRRPPRIGSLIRGLAGSPGNKGAEKLTRQLSKRVGGRSMGALLKARADIRARIRAMHKGDLTGQERIQVKRLRGALSLIEDEMGRPIGRAIGGSDTTQDVVSRSMGNLDNELLLAGVAPDSAAAQAAKVSRTRTALGMLGTRRTGLAGALTRARASGNAAAVGQVQTEINEVDDQILGLRADLVTLNATNSGLVDAQKELADNLKALKDEIAKQNAVATSKLGIGLREAERALADMIAGQLGTMTAQRIAGPSTGALARL